MFKRAKYLRKMHIRTTCGFEIVGKVGIKVRLGRMRSFAKQSDIERPYIPETFSTLQTLSRNLRNFVFPGIKHKDKNDINRIYKLGTIMAKYTQYK